MQQLTAAPFMHISPLKILKRARIQRPKLFVPTSDALTRVGGVYNVKYHTYEVVSFFHQKMHKSQELSFSKNLFPPCLVYNLVLLNVPLYVLQRYYCSVHGNF